ncbi:hypothetical protein [Corynebacterium freiburgense]|uniref:hypothetical protein n=1 Tax=Corynebacterium freiburgense TaxID=556548 RepID=UPI0003F74E1E|nr:hypothetical protein [Corynebacterium freiburgense]WJZ03009.1 hypothetical protein CFREI_08655 [Corynebacterium freiburgense]
MLEPVTRKRLWTWLKTYDVDAEVLDNGDYWLPSDDGGIHLQLDEDLYVIRMWGLWRGSTSETTEQDRIRRILIDHAWQIGGVKIIDDIDADGVMRIRFEYVMPVGEGMTDEQLTGMFTFWSGFARAMSTFEAFLPELVVNE